MPTFVERQRDTPSLSELIAADWKANQRNRKSRLILLVFRLLHPVAVHRSRGIRVAGWPLLFLYQVVVEWVLCVELPLRTTVGAGLRIAHGYALVVNDNVRIGAGCTLRQCTTIGVKLLPNGSAGPSPVLGAGVDVGPNVVILGPVTIGDHATIGAGAVVLRDVPAFATAVGNPARLL